MKVLCPICSDILLRHLCRDQISWFCLRCHQEMPNLSIVRHCSTPAQLIKSKNIHNRKKKTVLLSRIRSSEKIIQDQPDVINSYINLAQKRLEVVSFILNKINIILVNSFTSTKRHIENKINSSEQLQYHQLETSVLTKADFLRDSEFILLCICQAILVADNSILNSLNFNDFNNYNSEAKLHIEQGLFLDLMKTLVVDFINSISFNSTQNADFFILEIASYFEMVINFLIKLE